MKERSRGIAEGLGLLLVASSFLFVAFQIPQDRRIAQAELNTTLLEILSSRLASGLESDAYLGMWSKLYATQAWEISDLSDREIAAAELDALIFRAYAEAALEQHREGMMSEASWQETKIEIVQLSEFAVIRAVYDTYYRETPTEFTRAANQLLASPPSANDS
jgi:hypothetical protein